VIGTQWSSQYFRPVLPGNATKWQLDSVRFVGSAAGTRNGILRVTLVAADANGKPTGPALGEALVDETQMGDELAWVEAGFYAQRDLAPSTGYCLVFSQAAGTDAAATLCLESGSTAQTANTHWMTSGNSGVTWSTPDNLKDLRFKAMGFHDGTAGSRTAVTRVRVVMQLTASPQSRVESSTWLWNAPETDSGSVTVALP
jgi:hypothetical protein